MSGCQSIRFLDLVRDTIAEHGLAFAVRYYTRRMPRWEARFWLTQAYCG